MVKYELSSPIGERQGNEHLIRSSVGTMRLAITIGSLVFENSKL